MIEITNRETGEIIMFSVSESECVENYFKVAEDYLIFNGKNPNDYIISY